MSRAAYLWAPAAVLAFAPWTLDACEEADASLRGIDQALQQRNLERAVVLLRSVPAAQADCPSAALARGRIAASRGDGAGAVEHFSSYVEAMPDDAVGRLDLSRALLMSGKRSQAVANALQAAQGTRDPSLLVAAAQLLEAAGDDEAAETTLLQASRLSPTDEGVAFQLGVLYIGRQQYAKAEQEFRRVTRLNPANAQAFDYLGLSLYPQGKVEDAEEAFLSGLRVSNALRVDPFLPYNFARLLTQLDRPEEALTLLDQAVQLLPESRAVRYERAKVHHRLGNLPLARADAEAAIRLTDAAAAVLDSQIYYALVRICRGLGDDNAVKRYAELARSSPPARNTSGR